MRISKLLSCAVVATVVATSASAAVVTTATPAAAAAHGTGNHATWRGSHRPGYVRLRSAAPQSIKTGHGRHGAVSYLHPHRAAAPVTLNFTLPLRHAGSIDRVIATEARTHHYLSRAQIYSRFAPPAAQVTALRHWLTRHGYTITHVGRDRVAIAASAPTATVERTLATHLSDYRHVGYTVGKHRQPAYHFYANTRAPRVPARLGLATISGLTTVDRFYTQAQLSGQDTDPPSPDGAGPDLRAGGYYPTDLRSLYDVAGHGIDGTGQTIGFTLWNAGITQTALTAYSSHTSDTPITLDADCNAPTACNTQTVQPDHLLNVYESASLKTNYSVEDEVGLDVESAHGIAPGVAMKYYLTTNTDAGLESALQDAADDTTLHSVSNSWGGGGDTGAGLSEPFVMTTTETFQVAALAGTTFYFSTGDSGSYMDGYVADNPYVAAVGGSSVFSTGSDPSAYSTSAAWTLGGSWCSNLEPRPSWQTGPGITANAHCTGRATPDVSAVADPATGFYTTWSTGASTTNAGDVGGTSLAAPLMSGMEADTENFLNLQSYAPGSSSAIGFEPPIMYQLGNSASSSSYYRDLTCGNTAPGFYGPDGDAAGPGWDAATGWGEIDWFNYTTGYAIALGATGLSTPASIATHYNFDCAPTPSNGFERGIAMASDNVGFALGSLGSNSGVQAPFQQEHLPAGVWGLVNTYFTTADGGASWTAANSDMLDVACPTATTCVEVGDGGVIKRTTDSGTTWTAVTSAVDKALTSISCPTSTVCFAAGDRGEIVKSTDGGVTWSLNQSGDGNPIFGLSCPTALSCFATNYWGLIDHTSNGGTTWQYQSNPVYTGELYSLIDVSCMSDQACVAVGNFANNSSSGVSGDPIITTSDGGSTWQSATWSGLAAFGVDCIAGSTTCYAVGRSGSIEFSTDSGSTWTSQPSGTSNLLTGITCSDTADCVATGQNGTVDVLANAPWSVHTGLGAGDFLSGVTCASTNNCLAVGKQGMTLGFDPSNIAGVTQLAGGGVPQRMRAISCSTTTHCATSGDAGAIITTPDAGQTWLTRASGTAQILYGIGCSGTTCVADGAAGAITASSDSGATWTTHASGVSSQLDAVACSSATACIATGIGGVVLTSPDGGSTWAPQTSGTAVELSAVTCTSSSCYAVGALDGAQAVILKSTDGGTTWTPQTSNSPQPLDAIACVSDAACFAGGAAGTVVTTIDGGQTWTQQSNPLSGPTSALASDPSAELGLLSAACTSHRCVFGAESDGDILTTPLVTVTVNASGPKGTDPVLSGLAAGDPAISYSPSGQAAHVTGTLTCTTTATSASDPGSYPVSDCSGLSDPGHSVVYDLEDSDFTVDTVKTDQTIGFASLPSVHYDAASFGLTATATSGLAVTFSATGTACTVSGTTVTVAGVGSCSIKASQAGDSNWNVAPDVTRTLSVTKATPTLSLTATPAHPTIGLVTYHVAMHTTAPTEPTGSVTISGGGRSCTITSLTPAGTGSCGIKQPAGTTSMTAAYAGDADFSTAIRALSETVKKAQPSLTIKQKVVKHTSSGSRVTFTLTVHGVSGFTPTGTAQLADQHGKLCRATALKSGVMSCTVKLAHGRHTVKATYQGNSNYLAAKKTTVVHVAK